MLLISIFQAVGGAGEALRGNINSFLDNAGEGLTGNKASDAAHGSADYEKGGHGAVAQQGADDFKEGLNKVQGKST